MSKRIKKRQEKERLASKSLQHYLFYAFTLFIALILTVVYKQSALDLGMMPRVFALSLFLLIFSVFFFMSRISDPESLSILRHKFFIILSLWLGISVITLLLSSNPIEGLYDIIKTMFTISIAALGAMLFIKEEDWLEKLVKIVILSAFISAGIAFVQYYLWVFKSPDEFLPDGRKTIYRVVGVMAHKNLFSLSLLMMLPFVAYGVYSLKKYWKYLAAVALILVLALIVLLQARATWVGIMFASAFTVIVLIVLGKYFNISNRIRLGLLAVSVLGAVALGSLVFVAGGKSQNPYVKQLRSITDPKSPQNIHRVNIWMTTVEMIKEKPLAGFGPSNWKLHVGYYFKGRFFLEDQINWQRPHNDFLWVFAEKGLLGILLYLSIFGLSFFYLIRVIKNEAEQRYRFAALFIIFGLVGYLAASAFDFPYERIFHQAFLGLIFACIVTMYHRISSVSPIKFNKLIVLLPLVIFFAFGAYYGYRVTQQEGYLKQTKAELRLINQIIPRMESLPENQKKNAAAFLQNKWREVLRLGQRAEFSLKNLDPIANPVKYYIGLAYVNLGDMQNSLKYCLAAHERHPGSIKTLNTLGAVYFNLEQYDEAKNYLLKSMHIFPSHDAIQNLSAVYYKLEEYEKAYEVLRNAPKDLMSPQLENNMKAIEIKLQEME